MKLFLVKLLVRLTDIAWSARPNRPAEEFLAEVWNSPGMREYLYERERRLKDYITQRVNGTTPLPNTLQTLALGQLQEVSTLINQARRCHEAKARRISPQRTS